MYKFEVQEVYVVTETHNGDEKRVKRFSGDNAWDRAHDYVERNYDDDELQPCVYLELPDGTLTTEY